jgi:hypothetical protein
MRWGKSRHIFLFHWMDSGHRLIASCPLRLVCVWQKAAQVLGKIQYRNFSIWVRSQRIRGKDLGE